MAFLFLPVALCSQAVPSAGGPLDPGNETFGVISKSEALCVS